MLRRDDPHDSHENYDENCELCDIERVNEERYWRSVIGSAAKNYPDLKQENVNNPHSPENMEAWRLKR